MGTMRKFDTGATRTQDVTRDDPEGYLSPIAMERFEEYIARQRDLAWAAGLFEGEGCITIQVGKGRVRKDGGGGERRYQYPRLQMNLTDEDVLRRFAAIVGGSVNGPYPPRGTERKPTWSWVVQQRELVHGVASLLCPYLGLRRRARLYEVFGVERVAVIAGFSPIGVDRYNTYMTKHRIQADGKVRDSDNWQKGMPIATYFKGLWRHFLHAWARFRGWPVRDEKAAADLEEDLCAMWFNVQGALHELVKARLQREGKLAKPSA